MLVGGAVDPDRHLIATGHDLWQRTRPAELDQLPGSSRRPVKDLDRVPAQAVGGQYEVGAAGGGCSAGGNGDFVVVGLR